MADQDYSGIWYCCYWFPSNQHDGEDISEYYMEAEQHGNKITLHSLPNQINSYMTVNLTVEDDLVSGYWHEQTSPTGEFAGAVYSGTMQLLIDKSSKSMIGKWVGIGQEDGQRQIYCGKWEMTRAGHQMAHGQAITS